MAMELPDAIEVTGPGTARIGIAAGIPPQQHQTLQTSCRLQGVKRELIGGNNGGEEGVELQEAFTTSASPSCKREAETHRHKKTGP